MDVIRVLLVDDHPMIRRGLQSILAGFQDIQVIGEAEDGASALRAVSSLAPDVVLLDVQMVGPDGITVAALLHRESPSTKIIILSAHNNEEYIRGAMRVGAHAYLLKSSTGDLIVEAIRQVHAGKRVLSPALMDSVLQQFQDMVQAQTREQFGLSEQDQKMLVMVAQGATNEEIAQSLHWGERTVRRKLEEIMVKFGAKNRAQVVAEAMKRGLI